MRGKNIIREAPPLFNSPSVFNPSQGEGEGGQGDRLRKDLLTILLISTKLKSQHVKQNKMIEMGLGELRI